MKRLEEGLGYVFEFESEGTCKDFEGLEIHFIEGLLLPMFLFVQTLKYPLSCLV